MKMCTFSHIFMKIALFGPHRNLVEKTIGNIDVFGGPDHQNGENHQNQQNGESHLKITFSSKKCENHTFS